MIPKLHIESVIDPDVLAFAEELKSSGYCGDIETAYSSRLAVATDNSVYQQLPQAVLHPKSTHDVVLIGRLGAKDEFRNITFTARGGGTGTNGQALTRGVVVDMSRHMNRVLEINEKEGWVRVQAGVIKDQLNDAVRPFGLFFSPELSTSNRATIGGMVNTDASGQGSLKYGKTSAHVISLQAVFADGSVLESDMSAGTPLRGTLASEALRVSEDVCRTNRDLIQEKFPELNRFLTGYDLRNAIDNTGKFDITRILCGSEGTLAFITEAKLNLTPIPQYRTLVNVKYSSFDAALRNAPLMVEAEAMSVETIDSKVLDLAKQDIVWHSVSDLLTDVPGREMLGINIVEYAGNSREEIESQVGALRSKLDGMLSGEEAGIIGYQVCDDLESIKRIYNMRKKAVGLLGAAEGQAKPVAFAEDTCVPPENLADFIADFRALLDARSLSYGMFGHVDAGVLHVRPALDMCDPHQEEMMHDISDEVVNLVARYGGLMWGEHGKGFRSEYGPEFFGDVLFGELRRVKAAFDPCNKMNPGKICTPAGTDFELVKVADEKRGHYDRQIELKVRNSFKYAMECNGNGLCFNYDTTSPMCPSMKVTADRRHSPKGRAGLVREWLRLLAEQDVDILAMEEKAENTSFSVKNLVDIIRPKSGKDAEYDFSHEVYEAMNGCLACKVCASQCPVKVDVPSFRARFLNLYHTRYQRPFKDYLVANIETMLPLVGIAPSLMNVAITHKWVRSLTKKSVGYIDAPALSAPSLKKLIKKQALVPFDMKALSALSAEDRKNHVILVQDPFTTYYDAEVVNDFISLAVKLGRKPVLLPFKPNGKAQHIKGFLSKFASTAKSTAAFLREAAELGIPMVGVDPGTVLCYRDEYREVLGEERGDFEVLSVHEWLYPRLAEFSSSGKTSDEPWYLFAHCTEKTKMPNAEKEWTEIFGTFGVKLVPVPVGCCGMAGTFGHEADKFEVSKKVYDLSWKDNFEKLPKERCLVTGYSCRSQVKRFEHIKPKHPLQALLECL